MVTDVKRDAQRSILFLWGACFNLKSCSCVVLVKHQRKAHFEFNIAYDLELNSAKLIEYHPRCIIDVIDQLFSQHTYAVDTSSEVGDKSLPSLKIWSHSSLAS